MAFAEKWHLETSFFHLRHGEITITLDDIACLLHLPIKGILLSHSRLTKEEAMEMLIEELGNDPTVALQEVKRTHEAHARYHTLQQIYDVELLAAHQAVGEEVKADIHREWVFRCYLLYSIGTQLFVDTSSTYTDIVYLTYLSDIARVHEYNWGAATLAYTYHRLREGCMWKAGNVAASCILLVAAIVDGLFPEGSAGLRLLEDIIRVAEEAYLYRRSRAKTGGALDGRG
ncbi:protein MAIN-LIKE 1-like [Vicia villosa]|uniref:protein MAIN-LIKE 1-like n=1 Tax=Vicia villosa TaxID=3911 RepID=UPI00273C98E0|nr:protein MAIN-LIKE 1-like [Vicia villosa]